MIVFLVLISFVSVKGRVERQKLRLPLEVIEFYAVKLGKIITAYIYGEV